MPDRLCFVLIPSGRVQDVGGVPVDFDALYRAVFVPALEEANLEPVRARGGTGSVHRPETIEGLLLAEFAIVDLAVANASVFYQLGVRAALRRGALLTYPAAATFPQPGPPSEPLRYSVDAAGQPEAVEQARRDLSHRLETSGARSTETTLLEAVERPPIPAVDHTVTDEFRERVRYSSRWKEKLQEARVAGALETMRAAAGELDVSTAESGVVIDLLLSYRALGAWGDVIALTKKMAPPLARSTMVQEQLALALNRAGQQARAVQVLQKVIGRRGPSSETCAILGRVYKDQWEAARKSGHQSLAKGRLEAAIGAYAQGFEADWRDAYPGINAAMLMEAADPPDPRQAAIISLAVYAAERNLRSGRGDYWDHATLLEASVLTKDRKRAEAAFQTALASVREPWEPDTTARNLRIISEARLAHGEVFRWADDMQKQLEQHAAGPVRFARPTT